MDRKVQQVRKAVFALALVFAFAPASHAMERDYQKLSDVPSISSKEDGLRVIFVPLEPTDLPLANELRDEFEHMTGIGCNVRRLKHDWDWKKPDRAQQFDANKFNKEFRTIIGKRFRGGAHTVFIAITGREFYTGKNPYIFSARLADDDVKVGIISYTHLYDAAKPNWQQLMIERGVKEAAVVALNSIGIQKTGKPGDIMDFASSIQEIDAKRLELPSSEVQQIQALSGN